MSLTAPIPSRRDRAQAISYSQTRNAIAPIYRPTPTPSTSWVSRVVRAILH